MSFLTVKGYYPVMAVCSVGLAWWRKSSFAVSAYAAWELMLKSFLHCSFILHEAATFLGLVFIWERRFGRPCDSAEYGGSCSGLSASYCRIRYSQYQEKRCTGWEGFFWHWALCSILFPIMFVVRLCDYQWKVSFSWTRHAGKCCRSIYFGFVWSAHLQKK